jgi:hypothetical protein
MTLNHSRIAQDTHRMRNNRAALGQMIAPPTQLSKRKAGRQLVFVSGIMSPLCA